MKKIIQFTLAFCMLILFSSNVSQPGIYNSGGMAFTMLFPEDSLAYKKIQMQEEKIHIQLYKGFAVVKGVYKMVNTSNEKLSFKMGYPIKGIYNGGDSDLNQVQLDSIYKFKVKSNYKDLKIDVKLQDEMDNVITFNNDNWLTWQMDFAPNETNLIEVYFIVNTNNAQVARGYNRKETNTFIYLLESGSVWKQPIEKGTFIIELKDNLKVEDLDGISEHFNFKKDPSRNILIGTKVKFSPTPNDNLIITYFQNLESFDFHSILNEESILYVSIDELSQKEIPLKLMEYEAQNPYELKATALGYFPIVLTYIFIYGPMVLIGVFVFLLGRFIYKRIQVNRRV